MAAVCMLILAGGPVASGSPAAAPVRPGFCDQQIVVRDYLAPLAEVPSISGFLPSGRLRVGPSVLRIRPPRTHIVPIGRGSFEVSTERSRSSARLDWWMLSRLERMNRQGRLVEVSQERHQYIATAGGFGRHRFGFDGDVMPGLYRLTVEMQNHRKEKLARYQELFRALPAWSDLRLATDFTTLAPGETGDIRIDNFGTVEADHGVGYQLFDAKGEEVPLERGVAFPDIMMNLPAGYASACTVFKVPVGTPPGGYQIVVEVGDSLREHRRLTLPVQVVAAQ